MRLIKSLIRAVWVSTVVVCFLYLFCGGNHVQAAADDATDAKVAALQKRIDAVESKVDGFDKKLDAIFKAVTAPKAVVSPTAQPTVTTKAPAVVMAPRQPVGHTHTCANGHTWDHTMDGGSHRCPFCGLPQTIVDSTPKMVYPGGVTKPTVTATQPYQSSQFYSLGSGCANGSCQAVGKPVSSGWYLGKRLGR